MMQFWRACIAFIYQYIAKPILFLFSPEAVHGLFTKTGSLFGSTRLGRSFMRFLLAVPHNQSSLMVQGIPFANPVGLAAGFDYNACLTQVIPSVGFGFITVGTITYQPYQGNPTPQLTRLKHSQSILVNKGLKNLGAKKIIRKLEPMNFAIPVGVSIASTNKPYTTLDEQIEDIVGCFQLFEASKVQHSYYELNISCPNAYGNVGTFYNPHNLILLLKKLKKLAITRPIFAKLPIVLPYNQLREIVKICIQYNITTHIIGNLQTDRQKLTVEEQKLIKKLPGNLSGKPTNSDSLQAVKMLHQEFGDSITLIGLGGIFSVQDAKEYLDAGATAVQLITGMIYKGPQIVGEIASEIR